MTVGVREVDPADHRAAWRLNQFAFATTYDYGVRYDRERAGVTLLGAYGDGELVGVSWLRSYHQWYAGRAVPMCGLASVAVAPEVRGGGVARALLAGAIRRAREDGAAVSVLYPTVPHVYRSCGWEVAGAYTTVELPTAALATVPAGAALLRSAAPDDQATRDTVAAVYERCTRAGVGPLTRTGPLFTPAARQGVHGELTAVTLAERDGKPVGYARWERHPDPQVGLTAYDLLGVDRDATAALLRSLGGWRASTTAARLRLGDPVAVQTLLPVPLPAGEDEPWMLRVVDLERAVAARGWNSAVGVTVDLDVVDPIADWQAGRWRLEVTDGEGRVSRGGDGTVRLDVRGLSALYTGYASTSSLRAAGLLTHGDDRAGRAAADALDAAVAGPRPYLLDYF
jgi:predicted acetyltransferase